MGSLFRSFAVTLMVFGLAACGGGGGDDSAAPADEGAADAVAPAETAAPAADGQAVFANNCATCHGDDGSGGGPAAVGLEPPPPDLTDAEWARIEGTVDGIRGIVVNGSPGTAMIAWQGTLTDAEIDAVSEYVHGLGGGQ